MKNLSLSSVLIIIVALTSLLNSHESGAQAIARTDTIPGEPVSLERYKSTKVSADDSATLNQQQAWWNNAFNFRRSLTISNRMGGGIVVPSGYPLHLQLNSSTSPTAQQIYNASQASGNDIRIVYQNQTAIPRQIMSFTPTNISIWFPAQANLAGSDSTSYIMYYGNPSAAAPSVDPNTIFLPKPDAGTRLLMHFNEGSGTTVQDSSGYNNHGTFDGSVSWQSGRFGPGLDFKGGVVWIEDSASLRIGGNTLTVEAWFWLDTLELQTRNVVAKFAPDPNPSWRIFTRYDEVTFRIVYPGQTGTSVTTDQVQAQRWHHVAGVYNGTQVCIYLDGIQKACLPHSLPVYDGALRVSIGDTGFRDGEHFLGRVDHVRISTIAHTSFPYARITQDPGVTAGAEQDPSDLVTAPSSVTISGASIGITGEDITFSASVSPGSTTTPMNYTWEATGQTDVVDPSGGLSDSATFTWDSPGPKTVRVTASNSAGSVVDSHTITINAPPSAVTISGPITTTTGYTATFSAAVSPADATTPIAYTWEATDQDNVVHTGGGRSDTAAFIWDSPGEKVVKVTATNSAGSIANTATISVSVPPATITMTGPAEGLVATPYTFSTVVEPYTTSVPLNYVWQATDYAPVAMTDDVTSTHVFTWTLPGTKTITVTASNEGGMVQQTHTVTINAPPTNLTITGPITGTTGEAYTFSAAVKPDNATTPIAYTWKATDQVDNVHTDGRRRDTASFTWDTPGEKTIRLTAVNSGGEVAANHTITLFAAPAAMTISGPHTATIGTSVPFSATVNPATVTTPIAYTWEVTDQENVVHTDGERTDTTAFTWGMPGTKAIKVTATNAVGRIVATSAVTVNVPPVAVTLHGPSHGLASTPYTFTATVKPYTTTTPLNYTWQATDQQAKSMTDGISNTIALTWDEYGTKTITVTARNDGGSLQATHTLTLTLLPQTLWLDGPAIGEMGQSYAFTASVSPLDVSLPFTYTWESSDQPTVLHRVNEVSDTLTLEWETTGTRQITVTATNRDGSVQANTIVTINRPPVAWSLLFYLSGDNSQQHADAEDMINTLETIADNAHVNILVLWDDFGDTNTRLYHLQHDTDTKTIASPPLTVDWNPGERNMGDAQTLQDFVQWAQAEYPAQHTLLTVYDHGCGWAPQLSSRYQATWMQGGAGLAWDETDGDYLANHEIGSVLQTIADSGGKLDVVFYDASLNAMLEHAYEIRDSASYLVASQNVMNLSFPYDQLIATATDSTAPSDLARQMVEEYKQQIRRPTYRQGGTLSAIDLDLMGHLVSRVEVLATALRAEPGNTKGKLYTVYRDVQKFDLDEQGGIEQQRESVVDLQHFAELVANANLSQATKQAAEEVRFIMADSGIILAEAHTNKGKYKFPNAHGLSIYLPFGEETYVGTGCPTSDDFCQMPANKTCLRVRDYYTNATPVQLAFVQETGWDEWVHETIAAKYPCTSSVIRTTDAITESEDFPDVRPVNIISSPLPGKMDLTIGGAGDELYLPLIRR